MKRLFSVLLLFTSLLLGGWPCEAESKIVVNSPLPTQYMKKGGLGFCSQNTHISPPNIHNGIDITVPANTPVLSLCSGRVVRDQTTDAALTKYPAEKDKYWNSFLIVEHNCNGQRLYAYYGHVRSNVNKTNDIKAGDPIAFIRHDKSGSVGLIFI